MTISYEVVVSLTSAIAAVAAAYFAKRAVDTAEKLHNAETELAQRQFISELWDHMIDLREIDPTAPATPQVLKAVHTLELVALCCEGGMIDPALIKRTFANVYQQQYRLIEKCGKLPGLNKTGQDVLNEAPAAQDFFRQLETERLQQNKPLPLKGST